MSGLTTPPVVLLYRPRGEVGETDQEGKFLQLVMDGHEYLLFAPFTLHRYHNQILAAFLAENEIPYHWASPERLEFSAPGLVIRGGGRYRISVGEKTLELWDNSEVYGRFDASEMAEKLSLATHPLSSFEFLIS